MKKFAVYCSAFIILFSFAAFAQDDIQSLQAKLNEIKSKPVEQLSIDDVKYLESVVNMSSHKFGISFQKVVDVQKSIAKSVLQKYDTWLKEKNKAENLDIELSTEKLKTTAQGEVIQAQGDTITKQKLIIEQLQAEINKLKKQRNRVTRINKKLKNEKTNLENVMQENKELVSNISALLSNSFENKSDAPIEMKAELAKTECDIARLIQQNYLLTIERLKKDKEYLDNLRQYFKDTKNYPDDFYQYLDKGEFLILKFQESNSECVKTKAMEIKSSLDELKAILENKDCDIFCQITGFFSENFLILGFVVLAIIGIVLLLVIRRR